MPPESPEDITGMLRAWKSGDRQALDRLIPLVDAELRRLARHYLNRRRRSEPALETTSLLNDAYLRLMGMTPGSLEDRAHFFALCARIMRGILVDHDRARRSAKRGGGFIRQPLAEGLVPAHQQPEWDLVAIDEALEALARIDPRKAQVVEMRFFGGMTFEEAAEVLKLHPNSIKRDWRLAKLWLVRELSGGAPQAPDISDAKQRLCNGAEPAGTAP